MAPETSNLAGYAAGLVVSYTLNRKYTFSSKQRPSREIVRFLAVFIVAYSSNFVVLFVLIHNVGMHEGASQILAGVVYVGTSYLMNREFVFL
jgi:putative flippase GtrA